MIAFLRMILALALGAVFAAPAISAGASSSDAGPAYGRQLEGFAYPWPVSHFRFVSQRVGLDMTYMDVKPARPNGRVAVLLHGKNFCSATWQATIAALTDAGYRIIAPDQIGFCKWSKPARYQFSFQQLADNTRALLASVGVTRATITGRSTGGMLAIRYALMFPDDVEQLVLVDPIGLEDWQAKGVPWRSVDQWFQRDLRTSADGVRDYERATYYAGAWAPAYEPRAKMLAGMYRGAGRDSVAWDSALLDDMIFTQPVVYEFDRLTTPTLLITGDKDTTAIGKDLAPPALRATLGDYPALGKAAAAHMPHARLVEFPDLGHAPQIQAPKRFHKALLDGLNAIPPAAPDAGRTP